MNEENEMLMVRVKYYAQLKDLTGKAEEARMTNSVTPRQLLKELDVQYQFNMDFKGMRVAINDTFVRWDQPYKDGDLIVFIPPVSGG